MGTTAISANLDVNVIRAVYLRRINPGEDSEPVDVTVRLIHQFTNPNNQTQEIELRNFEVPADFLEEFGLADASPVEQTFDINIINPRYLDNLIIETQEVRDNAALITRVPVLIGDDPTIQIPPEQPFKDLEHESNIPPEIPETNIILPENDANNVLYSLEGDGGLELVQASQRIFLNDDGEFEQQSYNKEADVLYIENSITNFLPNPSFALDTVDINIPDGYELEGPALTVISDLLEGEVEDTQIWFIRSSNPNPFNAFNDLTVKSASDVQIFTGLQALTISAYYRIASDSGVTPFENFKVRVSFFAATGPAISTEEVLVPVGPQGENWQLLYASFEGSQIPLTAVKFRFEIKIVDINATDAFNWHLYLPQAEASSFPTTRTLDSRVLDTYQTNREIEFSLPFFLQLNTFNVMGPGLQGLVDTTTDSKDGFQFWASSNKLQFRAFDATGALLFSVDSPMFAYTEGDPIEYGVYLDGSVIEFYVEQELISSEAVAHSIDETARAIVGSLEASNTTINSRLVDFKILRTKPW